MAYLRRVMELTRRGAWHALTAGLAMLGAGCAAPVGVFTQHNDNARTGAALAETILNNANVNAGQFGRVARLAVRGSIYAQPLYVPEVATSAGRQDLVIVATLRNLVYAFAAAGRQPALVWGPVALGPAIGLPDPEIGPEHYRDIYGEVGVMSTPVVEPARNAMFVVAATREAGRYVHRLHRLDLSTGAAQQAPVVIDAPGFESPRQSQRSALLLENDAVYVAFASYGDRCPYRGWVFSYDAGTLARKAAVATSSGEGAGIWMGGQGPAGDGAGNVYLLTSNRIVHDNGDCPVRHPVDLSNSIVRLRGDTLAVASSFTPANNARLNHEDGDLGGAGALLVPGTNLLLGAGKEARFFLVDRTAMGGFDPARDDRQPGVVQRFFAHRDRCPAGKLGGGDCHHVHGTPVYWNGPMGSWIYVWPENDFLRAFRFDPVTQRIDCRGAPDPDCDPISRSTTMDPENLPGGAHGMPGGFLSLSANGGQAGSGIVWGLHAYAGNANQKLVDGILRAYDASDLTRELWNSRQNLDRDDIGPFAKFTWPTIARGRVYAPTFVSLTGRTVTSATSEFAPGLAVGPGGKLYLAWTGTDGRINLASSSNGRAFAGAGTATDAGAGRITLPDTSTAGPAVAADEGMVYLAWVGAAGHLVVGRSSAAGFAPMGELVGGKPQVGIAETSAASVGLAVGAGRLFVAWRGGDQRINVMSAATGAAAFDDASKLTLSETTLGPPALAVVEGKLFLSWTGPDRRLNLAELTGGTLAGKRTLDDASTTGPALVGVRSLGAAAPDLHLFSTAVDETPTLNVRTADDSGAFNFKLTFDDRTTERPAAAVQGGRVFVAWRDSDPAHQIKVARYNPGELAVYGLLPAP
jgi:hypothetical protein